MTNVELESNDPTTVFEAVTRIISELPAIGKDSTNESQGFKFRSVEAVLDALNPLLARYSVFYVPDVLERVVAQRSTRNGGVMYEVNLHVRYTFYGPGGASDRFVASAWGEGTDSGDKATNKAMTAAMKYMLAQVFAVSTGETIDMDRTSPEETFSAAHTALIVRFEALPEALQQKVTERIVSNKHGTAIDSLKAGRIENVAKILSVAEAKAEELAAQADKPPANVDAETGEVAAEAVEPCQKCDHERGGHEEKDDGKGNFAIVCAIEGCQCDDFEASA